MHIITRIQNFTLYLFLFFINFQELKLFGIDFFSIPKLTGFLYVLTIFPQINKFIGLARIRSFVIPVLLFFILLTIINLFHINEKSFYFFDFSLFQNILLFWFLINHGRKDYMILEKGMLSLALGSVALALLFSAGIGIEETAGRVSIFGDNENIIGLRMCISIMILHMIVMKNKLQLGKIRYLLLLPIPVMMKLMAETGSRVALIAFVLCFITLILLFKTKRNWIKLVVFSAGGIAFIFIWQFLMQYETLILRLLQSYETGDLAGRDTIYQSVLPLILDNPIFGVGQTGFFAVFGKMSPHNVFLEVFCYTGVVGLLIYLFFLFQIFKGAWKSSSINENILPLLLLIPIFGFLLSGQILTQKLGWAIFAYIVSSSVGTIKILESQFIITNPRTLK